MMKFFFSNFNKKQTKAHKRYNMQLMPLKKQEKENNKKITEIIRFAIKEVRNS